MPAVTSDQVGVILDADVANYKAGLADGSASFKRFLNQQSNDNERFQSNLRNSLRQTTAQFAVFGGAVGGYLAISQLREYADEWTRSANKIKVAGIAIDGVRVQQERLLAVANNTRAGFSETVGLYQRLKIATDNLGLSDQRVIGLVQTINKSLKSGGASVQEYKASVLQLGQALASGILQGDELRSLRENAPIVARAIANEFGVTVGQLKQLGAEGKLTTDRIVHALEKAGPDIALAFSKTIPTIADTFQQLENDVIKFVGTANEATGASQAIGFVLNTVSDNIAAVTAVIGVLIARGLTPLALGFVASKSEALQAAIANVRYAVSATGAARSALTEAQAQNSVAVANRVATATQLANLQATRSAIATNLILAESQRADALAFTGMNRQIAEQTGRWGKYNKALIEQNERTKAVITYKRALTAVEGEIAVATVASNVAMTNSVYAAERVGTATRGVGLAARVAAGGMAALSLAMDFLGGPIGVAIAGIALALYLLSERTTAAEQAARAHQEAIDGFELVAQEMGSSVDELTGKINDMSAAQKESARIRWLDQQDKDLANIQAQAEAARDKIKEVLNPKTFKQSASEPALATQLGLTPESIADVEKRFQQAERAGSDFTSRFKDLTQEQKDALNAFLNEALKPLFAGTVEGDKATATLIETLKEYQKTVSGPVYNAVQQIIDGVAEYSASAEDSVKNTQRVEIGMKALYGPLTDAEKKFYDTGKAIADTTAELRALQATVRSINLRFDADIADVDRQLKALRERGLEGLKVTTAAVDDANKIQTEAMKAYKDETGDATITAESFYKKLAEGDKIAQASFKGATELVTKTRDLTQATEAAEKAEADRQKALKKSGGGGSSKKTPEDKQDDALAKQQEELALTQKQIDAFGEGQQALERLKAAYDAVNEARQLGLKEGSVEYKQYIDNAGAIQALREKLQGLSEGKQLTDSVATSQEKLLEATKKYDDAKSRGIINEETYNRLMNEAKNQYDSTRQAVVGIAEAISEGTKSAKTFEEALANIGMRLLDLVSQAVFSGKGPFGDLFTQLIGSSGGIFGGMFGGTTGGGLFKGSSGTAGLVPVGTPMATGGPVFAGKRYKVGEAGVEDFIPHVPGRIVPHSAVDRQQTVKNDVRFFIKATGDKQVAETAAQAGEAAYRRAMKDAPGSVGRFQRRGWS